MNENLNGKLFISFYLPSRCEIENFNCGERKVFTNCKISKKKKEKLYDENFKPIKARLTNFHFSLSDLKLKLNLISIDFYYIVLHRIGC